MHPKGLSLLAILAGITYAGPWGFTRDPARQPFWTSGDVAMTLDGPAFHAFEKNDPNDPTRVELFELVYWGHYDHYYTLSAAEKSNLLGQGGSKICVGTEPCETWVSGTERIYVYNADAPGRVPLHRFLNGNFHFYTIDKTEGDNAGFKHEGVTAWVYPTAIPGSTQYYRWNKA